MVQQTSNSPGRPSQSVLDPAGEGAESIARLLEWMVVGAAAVWCIVIGLSIYALVVRHGHRPRTTKLLVIGGGAVVPTVLLTVLLCFALAEMPALHRPAPAGSLRVDVSGARWWWRITYRLPDGGSFETANEIRLAVDQPVEFRLRSEDVIHSFWIPSLGGKVDMIPGRETRLALHPTRAGVFRGICAEYCGIAHAQMQFDVVVMPAAEFEVWLENEARPASQPTGETAAKGRELFRTQGCGACHSVRSTEHRGGMGPDLTHLGGRRTLAAGTLPNETESLRAWLSHPHGAKAGALMPAFAEMPAADVEALVAYLEQLR